MQQGGVRWGRGGCGGAVGKILSVVCAQHRAPAGIGGRRKPIGGPRCHAEKSGWPTSVLGMGVRPTRQ
jgi:hypothetical protein